MGKRMHNSCAYTHKKACVYVQRLALLLMLVLYTSLSAQQTTNLYVDSSRGNSEDANGQSWATAYGKLEKALEVLNDDLSPNHYTVHIAKGEYITPQYVVNYTNYNSFYLYKSNVTILGGYPNGGGTRNPTANPTILKGSTSENVHVLVIAGVGKDRQPILIDGLTIQDGVGSNWKDDIYINGVSVSQKGGAGVYIKDAPQTPNTVGVTFNNVIFKNNITPNATPNKVYVGGAIYAENSSLFITNSTFQNNQATEHGGAIFAINNSNTDLVINIESSNFNNNLGAYGGGIYAAKNTTGEFTLNITDTDFESNKITSSIADGSGGALYLDNINTHVTNSNFHNNISLNPSSKAGGIVQSAGKFYIKNSHFSENGTNDSNGSNSGGGGAIYVTPNDDPTTYIEIDNSHFESNRSKIGGAILFEGSMGNTNYGTYLIKNSKFIANRSYVEAGAIRNNFFTGKIINSEFRGNSSGGAAGAVCFNSPKDNYVINSLFSGNYLKYEYYSGQNTGTPSGFAIHKHQNGSLWIVNSTITGNSGTLPSWVNYPKGAVAISGSRNYIINSIIYDNLNGNKYSIHNMEVTGEYAGHDVDTEILVYNSIIESGRTPHNNSTTTFHVTNDDFSSGNSFSENPQFVNPIPWNSSGNNNDDYSFVGGDYTLLPTSPAINRGDNANYPSEMSDTDLMDHIRIHDGRIDIGAYEYGAQPVAAYCVKPAVAGIPKPSSFGVSLYDTRDEKHIQETPNGLLVLRSKSKGFVITRVPHVNDDLSQSSIKNPVKGMFVYDMKDDCYKLYNGTNWKCIQRACNE